MAAPFAIALTAQVGFLVHQIAILEPRIGRAQAGFSVAALTVAAIVGRIGLGLFAPRLDIRRFTAFRCEPGGGAARDHAGHRPATLIGACALFGFSTGNLITLPSLVIQREFEAASFGLLVGLSWAVCQFIYAFGPGLLGVARDATGAMRCRSAFAWRWS